MWNKTESPGIWNEKVDTIENRNWESKYSCQPFNETDLALGYDDKAQLMAKGLLIINEETREIHLFYQIPKIWKQASCLWALGSWWWGPPIARFYLILDKKWSSPGRTCYYQCGNGGRTSANILLLYLIVQDTVKRFISYHSSCCWWDLSFHMGKWSACNSHLEVYCGNLITNLWIRTDHLYYFWSSTNFHTRTSPNKWHIDDNLLFCLNK